MPQHGPSEVLDRQEILELVPFYGSDLLIDAVERVDFGSEIVARIIPERYRPDLASSDPTNGSFQWLHAQM